MINHVRRIRTTIYQLRPLSDGFATVQALETQIELRTQALRDIMIVQHRLRRLLHDGAINNSVRASQPNRFPRRRRPPFVPGPSNSPTVYTRSLSY